jgi:uncharacterized protein (DUF2384 family)
MENQQLEKRQEEAKKSILRLHDGNQELAERWLKKENSGFNGEKPETLLQTEEGIRKIEAMVHNLNHGVF